MSCNEWDKLKTVVVGSVENFSPGLEFSSLNIDDDFYENAKQIAMKAYPDWYLDEVSEDLERLCSIFKQAGVEVLRPEWSEEDVQFSTPNWRSSGFDIYNVRDLHIVFGDTLVVSAPSSRFRIFEQYSMQNIFYEHFFEEGFRWVCAPTPKLKGEYLHEMKKPRNKREDHENTLHTQLSAGLSETFHYLDNDEVIFDAANIIRMNKDILFLVSSTGNAKAVNWLKGVLGPEYRFHVTDAYRSSHLDSTILPLNEGFVLLNGARVEKSNTPRVFDGWDKLYFSDVAAVPKEEIEFHHNVRMPIYDKLKSMGVESPLGHISSPWAGLNVMSIDHETVLVHDQQVEMIRALELKGFTVVPVKMRHCYSMLGGLHCTTLDVVRESR